VSVLVSSHRAEMKDQKVKVGAIHAVPIYMKKIETLQKVVSLIEEAGKQNVELLVFPEVFVQDFPWVHCFPHETLLTPCQYFLNSYAPPAQVSAIIEYGRQSVVVSASGGDLAGVREACKAAKVGIVLGVSERVKGGHQLFNSLVFINSA
jgi:nitrilase